MARPKIRRNSRQQEIHESRRRVQNTLNHRRRLMKHKKSKLPKSVTERVRAYRNKRVHSADSQHYIGLMNVKCYHCGALHFSQEMVDNKIHPRSFGDCCSHGAVPPACFDDFPRELQRLFERKHELSTEFFNRIRSYNSSFSFASFNSRLVNFRGRRLGPYSFMISGDIYYQINTAFRADPEKTAKYGQLFILDPENANKRESKHCLI